MRSLSVTRKNFGILSVSERLQRAEPGEELVELVMVASLHVDMSRGVWCEVRGVSTR